MREKATARLRGCDPAAGGCGALALAGNHAASTEPRPAGSVGEDVSHFLSEMSCGEVVAGSPRFPGRAFESSFLHLFPSPPLCERCTAAVSPPGGDKGQEIDSPACHVWAKFPAVVHAWSDLCETKLNYDVNEVFEAAQGVIALHTCQNTTHCEAVIILMSICF